MPLTDIFRLMAAEYYFTRSKYVYNRAVSVEEKRRAISFLESGLSYIVRIRESCPDENLDQGIASLRGHIHHRRYRLDHPDMFNV